MTEIDILEIDNKIQEKFLKEYEELPVHKRKLEEMKKTCEKGNIALKIKTGLNKSIEELKERIERLESKADYNFYLTETMELIEKYNNILKTPLKLSFTGKVKGDSKEKRRIVESYLKIAEKYYKIDLRVEEEKVGMVCVNCGYKSDFIVEENACICPDCGTQQEISQVTTSYKDTDRVNISAKYTYDRKVHFRDCINQYQGKQNCTIDQKVYDDLTDIFERHRLLLGDKNTKKEVRYSKITKDHVLMFLKELGYTKHYENVILIHSNMTGVKPDDISHLEDRLLADFDILVDTYDANFKNKVSRVNFISTQYVLYQLLLKYKHPCKKEDFVILKTMERKTFHDEIMAKLFMLIGWNFTPCVM